MRASPVMLSYRSFLICVHMLEVGLFQLCFVDYEVLPFYITLLNLLGIKICSKINNIAEDVSK